MSRSQSSASSATKSQEVLKDLDHHLARVHRELRKQNSFSLSFGRGVMAGLGATVGVTLVLTLFVFVVLHISRIFGLESAAQTVVDFVRR